MKLGPELVTNGGFDDDTGWDLAGCAIENGKLVFSDGSPTPDASQFVDFRVGKSYRVSFEISDWQVSTVVPTTGDFRIGRGSNPSYPIDRDGLHEFIMTPTDDYQIGSFQFWSKYYDPVEYFCTYKVDNVSIKEVLAESTIKAGLLSDGPLISIGHLITN